MAVGDYRLTNTRYVRPGVYIGYVRQPRPMAAADNPRYPCYVGRGNRLAQARNVQMHRAYVTNELLSFTTISGRSGRQIMTASTIRSRLPRPSLTRTRSTTSITRVSTGPCWTT
jgi:hypothetical protein